MTAGPGPALIDLIQWLAYGLVIEQSARAEPYPRRLILAFISGQPIHLVVADLATDRALIAAVYRPKTELWKALFTRWIER